MNVQGWSLLRLTSLISLPSNGLSRVFSSTSSEKLQLFSVQRSLWSQLSHPFVTTGRTRYLTIEIFVSKMVVLPFNMLYRFGIAFLPRSSSVQSLSCVWLWPHGLQNARPPCPSPTLGVYPNACSLSQWCHSSISSSIILTSSYPKSFPTSGSFQMSQLLASGGQVLEFQLQHQSFQWTPRTDIL